MHRHVSSRVVSTLVAALFLTACGDTKAPTEPAPDNTPASIGITPDNVILTAGGSTAQLIATVRNRAGTTLQDVAVTWESANQSIATVAANGTVTAVSSGTVMVTARAGPASGTATVTVLIRTG